MILRGRLRKPDIPCVPGKLPAFQRPDHRIAVADFATRGIHEIGAAFHLANELVIKHMLGLGMQRAVDRDHITDAHHRRHGGMVGQGEFLLDLLRQPVPIGVVQMHIKRLQAFEHGQANTPGGHCPNGHAFEIV